MKVAFIIGSLRKGSYNRKIANNVKSIAPVDWQIEEVEIGDLPLYNEDFDEQIIESYERIREQIKAADAIIFFCPEYNRSLTAALKNAIDVATRPANNNLWAGKKVAICAASTGARAANLASTELQKVCFMLGMQVSPTIANFANVAKIFDENGVITEQRPKQNLQKFVNDFDAMLSK